MQHITAMAVAKERAKLVAEFKRRPGSSSDEAVSLPPGDQQELEDLRAR